MMIHVRKGNVAKTVSQFSDNEKFRMPVICHRSNGISSTQILTVLSESGVERLFATSRSPLVSVVREYFRAQLRFLRSPQFDATKSVNTKGFLLKAKTDGNVDDSAVIDPWNPDFAVAELGATGLMRPTDGTSSSSRSPSDGSDSGSNANGAASNPSQLIAQATELLSILQAQASAAQQQHTVLHLLSDSIRGNANDPALLSSLISTMQRQIGASSSLQPMQNASSAASAASQGQIPSGSQPLHSHSVPSSAPSSSVPPLPAELLKFLR